MSAESTTGAAPQAVRRAVDGVLAVIVVAALPLTSFAVVLGEYLRDRRCSEFYLVIPLVVFFASPVALIVFCVRLVVFWRRLQTWGRLTRLAFPFVVILGCVLARSQGLFHRLDKAVHSWVRPQAMQVDFVDAARLATDPGEDSETAAVGHDILALPLMLENLAGAEKHLLKSLEIRERLYGPVHPRVAFSLRNLAHVLSREGKRDEAEAAYRRALTIYRNCSEASGSDWASTLGDLARLHFDMGKQVEAENEFGQAVQAARELMAADRAQGAAILDELAQMRWSQDDFAGAEKLFLEVIQALRRSGDEGLFDLANILWHVGALYRQQARHAEAEEYLKQAIEAFQKIEGPDGQVQVECLEDLAGCYSDQKRYAEAVPLFKRALANLERNGGTDTLTAVYLLEKQAAALRGLGRVEEAKGLEARAKAIGQTQQRGAETP